MTELFSPVETQERLSRRSPELVRMFVDYFPSSRMHWKARMGGAFAEALDRVPAHTLTLLQGLDLPTIEDLRRFERLAALQVANNASHWHDIDPEYRGCPQALAEQLLLVLENCRRSPATFPR